MDFAIDKQYLHKLKCDLAVPETEKERFLRQMQDRNNWYIYGMGDIASDYYGDAPTTLIEGDTMTYDEFLNQENRTI